MADENVTRIGSGGRLYSDAREKDSTVRQRLIRSLGGALAEEGEDTEEYRHDPDTPPSPPPPPPTPLPLPPRQRKPEPPKPEKKPRDWREINSTILELVGISAITAGCWEIKPWLGLIVLGFCFVLMGLALSGVTLISRSPE